MATLAVLGRAWEAAFWWLGLALVIDGIDGIFARMAKVEARLPRFSGERLDLVVDYVTYVFVPALALLQAGFLPGPAGLVLACGILLSSLFHFSDTESKADDYSFVGFPAIWNVVTFYIFAFQLPQGTVAAIVVTCVALTFVPLRWTHPLRTRRWQPATVAGMVLWSLAAASTLRLGFPAGVWEQAILLLAGIYGLVLTLSGRRVGKS